MAEKPPQSAIASYMRPAHGERASATVNPGYTATEVAMLLESVGTAQQAGINKVALRLRTTSEAVYGFIEILRENAIPTEQLAEKLTLIAQRHGDLLKRLADFDPANSQTKAYIETARESVARAASLMDYDGVDRLLSRAEDAQEEMLRRAEEQEVAASQVVELRRRTAVIRAQRAELCLIRLDYSRAATQFLAACEIMAEDDSSLKLQYQLGAASALKTQGEEKGDDEALKRAIHLYREVPGQTKRDCEPLDWARMQNHLGGALLALGERESGTEHLEEAAAAFRLAQEVCREAGMTEHDSAFDDQLRELAALIASRGPK